MEDASAFVVDETASGGRKALSVLLLHANANNPLRPPQADHGGMLFTYTIPSLIWDAPKEVEMQLTVAAPLCKELGMEKWWEKFAAIPFPRFKGELKKLLESPKRKLSTLRVKQDRTMRWRGESLSDACQVAWFRVPEDEVAGILARSGRDGLLFDISRRSDEKDDVRKVNLPSDWTLADALRNVGELEKANPAVKATLRGIVAGPRGYMLRVLSSAYAEVTTKLMPDEAEQMGPALNMRHTSTWIVKNVPRGAAKQTIIKAFATQTDAWAGWAVLPLRIDGQPRGNSENWIVGACSPPPEKEVVIGMACITIDRFEETRKVAARVAPWFRLKPVTAEQREERKKKDKEPTSIWEEQGNEEEVQAARESLNSFTLTFSTQSGQPRATWADESEHLNQTGVEQVQEGITEETERTGETSDSTRRHGRMAARDPRTKKPHMVAGKFGKSVPAQTSKPKVAPAPPMPPPTAQEEQPQTEAQVDQNAATLVQVLQQLTVLTAQLAAKDEVIARLTADVGALRSTITELQAQLVRAGGTNSSEGENQAGNNGGA